jgi:transposase-like protein
MKNCPSCGKELKIKIIKKGNNWKRAIKSFICTDCNYAEYDSNEDSREQMILTGYFDEELGIKKFEDE